MSPASNCASVPTNRISLAKPTLSIVPARLATTLLASTARKNSSGLGLGPRHVRPNRSPLQTGGAYKWSHEKIKQVFPEVRERAVRMVLEHRGEYSSLWAAIESIAPKIGCVPQTLNEWVRKHEVETGMRDGVTSAERERVKALEREVKELRKANEILKLASAFFAQAELDRRFKS